MEWIDGNIGSRLTMKYPAVWLVGPKASGEVLSVAYAGSRPAPGHRREDGARRARDHVEDRVEVDLEGRRPHQLPRPVRVEDDAYGCKSHVQCDALILDDELDQRHLPLHGGRVRDAVIGHEATVSKVADEQLFYLMSRGLSEEQAMGMVVNGFIEPITKTLPMEYAVEWSRLIELQMEGSVG
jgi:Fe-S cluster assembly protein SufB